MHYGQGAHPVVARRAGSAPNRLLGQVQGQSRVIAADFGIVQISEELVEGDPKGPAFFNLARLPPLLKSIHGVMAGCIGSSSVTIVFNTKS